MTIATSPATSAPPRPAVPFQQVLLLCVPALIVGLVFRVAFLIAIPEIYYGADSNSYFEAASKLWTQGDFLLNAKRRFLYPIVLIFMPLLPGSTAVGTAVVQHLLGLVILVGIGWVVAQMTRFPQSMGATGDVRGGGLAAHALVRARDDRGSLAAGGLRCRGCDCRTMRLAQGPETLVLVPYRGRGHRRYEAARSDPSGSD